jgi:hypothetical protein
MDFGTTMGGRSQRVVDDYERYCSYLVPDGAVSNALLWWLEPRQQKEYPVLAPWAVNIHFIPAMSSESERIFSGAKKTNFGP